MNKFKRKRGKHDRSKRREYISKEKEYSSDCCGRTDFVSDLELQQSKWNSGKIVPYFTLNHTIFSCQGTVT